MRVKVHSGDGSKLLGLGHMVGEEEICMAVGIINGELTILTNPKDAAQPPENMPPGFSIVKRSNPKIILDNGDVVYGAQVWFEEVDDDVQVS